MSNKCLITKLNGVVNNSSLLKVGELRIKIHPSSNGSPLLVYLLNNKDIHLNIIGDGYFTNQNGNVNNGKKRDLPASNTDGFYVSSGEYEISIDNKYALTRYETHHNSLDDYSELRLCKNLSALWVQGADIDLSILKDLSLETVVLTGNKVTGNLSDIAQGNLKFLQLSDSAVKGDISVLGSCAKLNYLNVIRTACTGDIASLKNLPLTHLYIGGTTPFGNQFYGDLATVSATLKILETSGTNDKYTWSSRPSSSSVFYIAYAYLGDNTDKALNDLANCAVPEGNYPKTITIYGNRTSASDAAISTLQSKGFTVLVTSA